MQLLSLQKSDTARFLAESSKLANGMAGEQQREVLKLASLGFEMLQ